MTRRKLLVHSILVAVMVLAAAGAAHAAAPVNASLFGKVAIEGYDAVAYHTEGRAVAGDRKFTADWKGATWRFATAANRDLFKAAPEKYAPQYGGYCAWAVSKNTTAGIDPQAFEIVDGKLYLNYSLDVHKQWKADMKAAIERADRNWPALLAK